MSTILQPRCIIQFEKEFNSLKAKFGRQSSLPDDDIVTLASDSRKKKIIAGKSANDRSGFLQPAQKKKLQSDPTCTAADRYGQKPAKSDRLNKKNPYNTDNFIGLPPEMHRQPERRNSCSSTFQPVTIQNLKWLFFVAKRDGSSRHFLFKDLPRP